MTTFWTDPVTAAGWAEHDAQRGLLALPRAIAAQLIAADRPDAATVADIGSGPGDFLSHLLRRLPDARGIWSDISETMAGLAREALAGFGERVSYRIADMSDFGDLPDDLDAIVSSRAVHHLGRTGLRAYYAESARHLAPGGWLVNLDHFGAEPTWDARLRAARTVLVPRTTAQPSHHHDYPLTSVTDHLDALAGAGFTDVDVPWRSFITGLFMARREG